MKLDSLPKVYVPRYGGNRDATEGQEMRVHLLPLKYLEVKKLGAQMERKRDGDHDIDRDIVTRHVVKIENLEVDGKAITTGAELYACDGVPAGLLTEIIGAINDISGLGEKLEKN